MHLELEQFEALPLPELQAFHAELAALIERKQEESRGAALAEISRLAGKAGLSAETVTDHLSGRRRKRTKLPPKYRDPHNPANTWAGRGKRPKWLEAKIAAGHRIEEFALAPESEVPDGVT